MYYRYGTFQEFSDFRNNICIIYTRHLCSDQHNKNLINLPIVFTRVLHFNYLWYPMNIKSSKIIKQCFTSWMPTTPEIVNISHSKLSLYFRTWPYNLGDAHSCHAKNKKNLYRWFFSLEISDEVYEKKVVKGGKYKSIFLVQPDHCKVK